MKKSFMKILTMVVAFAMVITSVTVFAAQPVANDDGETYTFSDSFTDGFSDNWTYNGKKGWGDPVVPEVLENLTFNNRGPDSADQITANWLSIESRAPYNGYDLFPGMNYNGSIPNGSTQNISVILKKGNTSAGVDEEGNMVGGGVRFLVHDNGSSYYELYILRGIDNTSSNDAVTYILSKVENGVRTELYRPAKENQDIGYHISPYDITNIDISINPEKGEITYNITTGKWGNAILRPNNWLTHQNLQNTVTDSSIKDITDNYGVQLFAAGQGGCHALFTNFNITATRLPSSIYEKYTDDFSSYGEVQLATLDSSTPLNSNWKSYSGIMGYDEKGKVGILTETDNQAKLFVPALNIEARSADNSPWMSPCMVYTGNYPATDGYEVSFTMIAGRGGGIRIATDDSLNNYYEVYLKQMNPIEIAKIENSNDNNNRTRKVLYTKTSHEGDYNGASGAVAIWNNVYNVTVKVSKGAITFKVNTRVNSNYKMTDEYTVTDSEFPYKASKVALFACGQGGEYTRFTNFEISSYDYYANKKEEPKNVLYYNVAKDLTQNADGVIDLGKAIRIRKVVFVSGSGKVEVSKDNTNYYELGQGSEILNTKSDIGFEYVRIPVGTTAKVYTDVDDGIIEARQYSTPEFQLISNGSVADPIDISFSDGNGGSTATYNSDSTFYVKGKDSSTLSLEYGNTKFNTTLSVTSQFNVTRDGNSVTADICFDKNTGATSGKGIVCAYNAKGELIDVIFADATINGNIASFEIENVPEASKLSLMLWKDLQTLQPLCSVYDLN